MSHKLCHSVSLLLIVAIAIIRKHVSPIIRLALADRRHTYSITSCDVSRNVFHKLLGILPICHHLRHCRSRTSCCSIIHAIIYRAKVVERLSLIPLDSIKQWRDSHIGTLARLTQTLSLGYIPRGISVALLHCLNSLLVELEIIG